MRSARRWPLIRSRCRTTAQPFAMEIEIPTPGHERGDCPSWIRDEKLLCVLVGSFGCFLQFLARLLQEFLRFGSMAVHIKFVCDLRRPLMFLSGFCATRIPPKSKLPATSPLKTTFR